MRVLQGAKVRQFLQQRNVHHLALSISVTPYRSLLTQYSRWALHSYRASRCPQICILRGQGDVRQLPGLFTTH
jgi:hypothetical protein